MQRAAPYPSARPNERRITPTEHRFGVQAIGELWGVTDAQRDGLIFSVWSKRIGAEAKALMCEREHLAVLVNCGQDVAA
jgi:hypothetical protein